MNTNSVILLTTTKAYILRSFKMKITFKRTTHTQSPKKKQRVCKNMQFMSTHRTKCMQKYATKNKKKLGTFRVILIASSQMKYVVQ